MTGIISDTAVLGNGSIGTCECTGTISDAAALGNGSIVTCGETGTISDAASAPKRGSVLKKTSIISVTLDANGTIGIFTRNRHK